MTRIEVKDEGCGNAEFDALLTASRHLRETGEDHCYAFETVHGWIVSDRKPSIRFGAVIEVRHDGGQYAA